jgi:hypothetical protein
VIADVAVRSRHIGRGDRRNRTGPPDLSPLVRTPAIRRGSQVFSAWSANSDVTFGHLSPWTQECVFDG